jgi:hypothetical protein
MPTTVTAGEQRGDTSIFARIFGNGRPMSEELARYILSLGFDNTDQARMEELTERNQQGELAGAEHDELMAFVRAGHLLALLHSQARQALKTGAR